MFGERESEEENGGWWSDGLLCSLIKKISLGLRMNRLLCDCLLVFYSIYMSTYIERDRFNDFMLEFGHEGWFC